jgi:hypothetical protein
MGFPAASCTPVVTVAVYPVPSCNGLVGTKVATRVPALYETTPATGPSAVVRKNVEPSIVELFISSEKVTEIVAEGETWVSPLEGVFAMTVGGV